MSANVRWGWAFCFSTLAVYVTMIIIALICGVIEIRTGTLPSALNLLWGVISGPLIFSRFVYHDAVIAPLKEKKKREIEAKEQAEERKQEIRDAARILALHDLKENKQKITSNTADHWLFRRSGLRISDLNDAEFELFNLAYEDGLWEEARAEQERKREEAEAKAKQAARVQNQAARVQRLEQLRLKAQNVPKQIAQATMSDEQRFDEILKEADIHDLIDNKAIKKAR